jgi:hypothetical protein
MARQSYSGTRVSGDTAQSRRSLTASTLQAWVRETTPRAAPCHTHTHSSFGLPAEEERGLGWAQA